jgi:hypothetical protein
MMAEKMRTTEEKAIKAILKAEESRQTFKKIRELLGCTNHPLTQVDILTDPNDPDSPVTTVSKKYEVETQILQRNRKHSLQANSTPFLQNPVLAQSIDPTNIKNGLDTFLNGSFVNAHSLDFLSETEKTWLETLQRKLDSEISLTLTIEDFRRCFKGKQECTASSPSGQHMGHYKVALECLRRNNPILPELILAIAQLSLLTSTPLQRWNKASQVVLEKGKGRFVENLRIIQLCEADLNFVLHAIWGHRLIRHASTANALEDSQYAVPGQTCNNAILNKVLFLDLSRQTLSPGVLTVYDALAAFDHVIAGLAMITCQRMGLPCIAGLFMYSLLKKKGIKFDDWVR